jgi:hypothetical protein
MKFNINDDVKVRLTPYGLKVHAAHWAPYHSESAPYCPPKIDSEGYSKFQLWDLMAIFGPSMYMGNHNSFDTNILL